MCWAWMIRTLLILFSPYLVVTVMTTNSLYFICSSSFDVTYMCIKISYDVALVSITTPSPSATPSPFSVSTVYVFIVGQLVPEFVVQDPWLHTLQCDIERCEFALCECCLWCDGCDVSHF
jgi:hypothetical protein